MWNMQAYGIIVSLFLTYFGKFVCYFVSFNVGMCLYLV